MNYATGGVVLELVERDLPGERRGARHGVALEATSTGWTRRASEQLWQVGKELTNWIQYGTNMAHCAEYSDESVASGDGVSGRESVSYGSSGSVSSEGESPGTDEGESGSTSPVHKYSSLDEENTVNAEWIRAGIFSSPRSTALKPTVQCTTRCSSTSLTTGCRTA